MAQGLDLIPTVHLGSVAHGLEKQGIRTERGNINRRIKADNARLRELNGDIRTINRERNDIINPPPPPKPQFIIDLEKSIKAKESVGYEKWAVLFNLQQMARTLIYIQENGYMDIDSLQSAHQTSKTEVSNIQTQLDETKAEITALRQQKEATETYRRTVDVWKEYNSNKWWRQSSKDKFYEDNKKDIEDYKVARDYIYVELKLEKFPNLKNLSGRISELTTKQNDLQKSLTEARQKSKMLSITTHNTRLLLGYKNLEEQSINPVEIPPQSQDLWVYTKSYVQAEKADETAKYFQSKYLDKDCAEVIQTSKANPITKKSVEQLTKEHGIERVGWVLANAIMSDTTNMLDKYRDWAAEKNLPVEPRTSTVLVADNKLVTIINHYQDILRETKARYDWEQGQFNKISFKNKMAIATDMANERNRNRTVPTHTASEPSKPKKKSHERD